jgi:multidomain signaling protein FimX
METAQVYQILVNQGTASKADAVLSILRRAGLNVRAREFEGDQLPDDVPGSETQDLILLFPDTSLQSCEALLRKLQTARRDIPCLLICRSTARCLPMLRLGAAALIGESLLESGAGQSRFVYQVRRELEHLQQRRQVRRAASSIRELEQRLQLFTESTSDALACLQDGLHKSANPAWLAFFGVKTLAQLHNIPFLDLVADQHVKQVRQFLCRAFCTDNHRCEFMAVRGDGSEILAILESASISVNGEHCLQLIIKPACGNARQDNAVREARSKDLHSGLLNQAALYRLINHAISSAVYQGSSSAIIMLSSAQLADIAAVLGRTEMHVLLRNLAATLSSACPAHSSLGRLDSGDFLVMLPGADLQSCQTLMARLESIPAQLQPLLPSGLNLNFSMGAAMISDEAPDADTLLMRARQHQSLRRHKQQEDTQDNGDSSATLELVKHALHDKSVLLVYQPTVPLKADAREYYEVRIRLPLADRPIYPGEFLETANLHGYGERIDRYVISQCLAALAKYNNPKLALSISLSANSILSQTLLLWLAQQLQRRQLSPAQLILQLGEIDVLSAPDCARDICAKIRDLGFELTLTQFGCCLDPFRVLGQIQVDYVKLDGSLLHNIAVDTQQYSRLREVVSKLHAHGVRVIAPLVEDISLLPLLWQANVNFVQGDALQRPGATLDSGRFQEREISAQNGDALITLA